MHLCTVRAKANRAIVAGLCGAFLFSSVPVNAFADTETDLASARAKLEEIGRQSDQTTRELGELTSSLEKTRGEIAAKEGELSEYQGTLSQFVSSEYKDGGNNLLQVLTSTNSFSELISRVVYMNKVAETQADTIAQVKTVKQELSDKQDQQEKSLADVQKKVDDLNSQRTSASELVNSLDAKLQEELKAEAEANAALNAGLESSKKDTVDEIVADTPKQDENKTDSGSEQTPAPTPDQTPDPEPAPTPDSTPETTPEPAPNPSGNAVVDRARSKLGCEYVWGGVGPYGFDCSGFVSYCLTGSYSRIGTTNTFMGWPQVSNPQPGDVCTNWGHCGIYIGNGQMIHASTYGVGVIVGPVQSGMIYVRRG